MCCQAAKNVSFNIHIKLLSKDNLFEGTGRMTVVFRCCSGSVQM